MKNFKLYLFLLLLTAGLLVPSGAQGADSKRLITYYPSLYGEYERLRLLPRNGADLTNVPPCVIGTLYSNQNSLLRYCYNDGTGLGRWGNVPDIWLQNQDNTYLTDTAANPNLRVGIGTSTPEFKLTIKDNPTILAKGAVNSGVNLSTASFGTSDSRLLWYPRKAAFRAGQVTGTQWNDLNIGIYSVAMGKNTTASGASSTVGGGENNLASGQYATIIGGLDNTANANYAAVAGGRHNTASGNYSMIYGGQDNQASGSYAMILGGRNNVITTGNTSVIGGGESNSTSTISAFIGGGKNNLIDRLDDGNLAAISGYSVIGGGAFNNARHDYTIVGGGENNSAMGYFSNISGGGNNTIGNLLGVLGRYSTISGGQGNIVLNDYANIAGGKNNEASGAYTVIGGGQENIARGNYSTVAGGERNTITGTYSMILGGTNNSTAGDYDLVGGRNVQLTIDADRTFAWGYSDDNTRPIVIDKPDVFIIAPGRITGGDWNPKVGIRDPSPAAALEINAINTNDDYLTLNNGNTNVFIIKNNGPASPVYIGAFRPTPSVSTHAMQFGNQANNAFLSGTGQWTSTSSRKYKENIRALSSKDAEKALDELNPVTFYYRVTPEKQNVGFIAEDVPQLVAMNDRISLSTLDIVAVLTQTVKDQEQEIKKQNERMEKIKNRIHRLKNILGD